MCASREEYDDQDSEIARLDRLYGVRPSRGDDEPGSSYEFAAETAREGEHGGPFHYVSLNLQVLGWVMERATGVRLPELIGRELWAELGTEHEAYIALDGAGSAQLEGGFCSSLRDLARFGLMLCRDGRAEARQVVPTSWIDDTERNGDRAAFAAAGIPESQHLPAPSYRNNFWVARAGRPRRLHGRRHLRAVPLREPRRPSSSWPSSPPSRRSTTPSCSRTTSAPPSRSPTRWPERPATRATRAATRNTARASFPAPRVQ